MKNIKLTRLSGLLTSVFLCGITVNFANAAISNYDGDTEIITNSYSGQTNYIIDAKNNSIITIKEGITFNNNQFIQALYDIGTIINANNSKFYFCSDGSSNCNGGQTFNGNKITQDHLIRAENNSEFFFGNNVSFDNNDIGEYGGALSARNSNFKFGNNISFSNNLNSNSSYGSGQIVEAQESNIEFGDNIKFNGNAGRTIYASDSSLKLGNNVELIGNGEKNLITLGNTDFTTGNNLTIKDNKGGIYASVSTFITKDNFIFDNNGTGGYEGGFFTFQSNFEFGNNSQFINNYAIAIVTSNSNFTFGDNTLFGSNINENFSTGAIRSYTSILTFGNDTKFINNYGSYAGGIYAENNTEINFNGSTLFENNRAMTNSSTPGMSSALRVRESIVEFNLTQKGQSVVFKDNYIVEMVYDDINYKYVPVPGTEELTSIGFDDGGGNVNFNLAEGAYADLRDGLRSDVLGGRSAVTNKNGSGSLYLWGNNNGYFGEVNVNDGNLYAMFKEGDTEWNGQRSEFKMDNALINFGDRTYFRPMMNNANNKLAQLENSMGTIIHFGTTYLAPYDLSRLNIGDYSFINNYDGFSGWSSDLAELIINGTSSVDLTIKRDLNGYEGLSALADIYRKRTDLSLMEREVLDNIYITGVVPQEIKDMFQIVGGNDYEIFETVHRASVRQFNRQVVSRVQNKNCPSCGRDSGYSDQHFWFNISHNEIKKDSTSKSLGYKYDPNGFAMGYDYDIIPNELNIGVAMSYATGEVKTKTTPGIHSVDKVDEYLISTYGKYKPFRAYVSWNAGGGLMTNKTRLATSIVNTRGEYDTYAFFANAEFGYDLGKTTCEVFEPYFGLEYTHIFSEGYDEKGIGSRHFDRMDWDIFEVPVGVRMSKDLFWNEYIFTPAIDLAYARNFGDTSAKTTAAFVGNRADRWSISSSSDKRDSLRFNFNFKINNLILPFALNLGYSIDYRSDYYDQQFYGTLRWDF